jgi:TolA-binding protein
MRRCHSLLIVALTVGSLLTVSQAAYAQSDAETAMALARTAYDAEDFESARDHAQTASQTDADNPDVFLLLGKSHFQLGELDGALTAWRTLLKLAPDHQYGRRMVNTLEGQGSNVEQRLRFARQMIAEGLITAALTELHALKTHPALTDVQQQNVYLLLAETLILNTQGTEAQTVLSELASRHPATAESLRSRTLAARAKLAVGGAFATFGLAELSQIVDESPESEEAKVARLELLLFRISRDENVVAELAAWAQENASLHESRLARLALRSAVDGFLAASAARPTPDSDTPLNDADKSALAAADYAFRAFVDVADQVKLAYNIASHFEKRYAAANAFDTARDGLALFDQLELSDAARENVRQSLARIDAAEATNQYIQISRDLAAAIANPSDLKDWIDAHPGHDRELEARRALIFAFINVSLRDSVATPDATISASDKSAIAAAAQLIPKLNSIAEVNEIVKALTQHFQTFYFERGAQTAAIDGVTLLIPLESPIRRAALLHILLQMQSDRAITELQLQIASGTVPTLADAMPASLSAAAATAARISKEYPATSGWTAQAKLAKRVLETAASVAWPTRVVAPKAAHTWALSLAFPVVLANANTESAQAALAVVDQVVNELSAVTHQSAALLASDNHEQLLILLPTEHALWSRVALRHVDLMMADASRQFDGSVRSGEGAKNEQLTELQQGILTLLAKIVNQRPAMAQTAMEKLAAHLSRWTAARHDSVVESAYETFSKDLPPVTQRRTQLAIARLWFSQVLRENNRIVESGFAVPRKLAPLAEKALARCYQLSASMGAGDPLLAEIAALRNGIIDHYLSLDYDDVAAVAIRVHVDPANDDLDESAQLELAGLKRKIAEREIAQLLKQHDGKKQLAITPAVTEAIAAYKQFITDHPTSHRVSTAAESVFAIGRHFENYEAWLVAADIYEDFGQFAAPIASLTQMQSQRTTFPERAAMARATALHTRATAALQDWSESKPEDTPAPDALSEEFQTAIAAWQKIIAEYQERPVAQAAIARIMGIAHEYASIDSWEVADATYAGLMNLELPLQSPERLEFGRAICQLGKVLPDHARSVLAALALTNKSGKDKEETRVPQLNNVLLGSIVEFNAPAPYAAESRFGMLGREAAARELKADIALDSSIAAAAESAPVAPALSVASAGANEEADGLVDEAARMAPGGGGFGGAGGFAYNRRFRQDADAELMAAVRSQLDRQAQQVAMLRDDAMHFAWRDAAPGDKQADAAKQEGAAKQAGGQQQAVANVAVLTEAELQRQQLVMDAVYKALSAIRIDYPNTPTEKQARDEIFVIVNHWREIGQWDRAAQLAGQFLADNSTDVDSPRIRQDVARDWLTWASMGLRDPKLDREELLGEIARRFDTARTELQSIIVAFPDDTKVRQQAQWDVAVSFLTQARVVAASSPTLARGQYVRASTELLNVARMFHDHPQIGTIPDMLWNISNELTARGYQDEAITVWTELQIHYPTHPLADQSALRIAQTWQSLQQPLRAVEAFLELNFSRGGNDTELQNTIYQIAVGLKNEKRWIESLHVLQTFVDSFPSHANAGQSLTMIGQIHQANEVWEDAIKAYSRVIDEFPTGTWTTEARWSIAECTINLSLWQEAAGAYAEFQQSYPEDGRIAEAARRIEVLKTLKRYQDVVDEDGQRKAFDAQYQVATIVHSQLSNPVKAIIEYRKVAANWPKSHLADDALFETGKIYLSLGEPELARTAFLQSAEQYPESPLADDALLLVGTSYVSEADRLTVVDRGKSLALAKDIAQKQAYQVAQGNRRRQQERNLDQITELKRLGQREEAANKEAYFAGQALQFDAANTLNASNWAAHQEEVLSAEQLADRQDKINAALRKAVASFRQASRVRAADKADDALLQMAQIYDERLRDSAAAMATWEEIVRQYSGTTVAQDASWKMARYFENEKDHANAIAAYQTFFRNYRRSPRAGAAQAAIAENHEQLGEWVQAMDAYTNYVNNFPEGPLLQKARDQINWIKTYRL